ncbi:MAG: SipW-dependent-type signal peptide-containing protein [Gracilibacteraceae bacterium]|jgi:predicted ribosomally synthesized peptide with SipW-like signal peptide|nr:SipW-dependent-type signal peptide-containing protein [Gracilibacteraceae bacterium]
MSKKKILSLVLCVALVGAVSIGATLAYLTDSTSEISNLFTIGNVSGTLQEKIEVWRANGDKYKEIDWTSDPQTVNQILPGDTISKDPRVAIDPNSAPAYVFLVTKTDAGLGDLVDFIKSPDAFDTDHNWVQFYYSDTENYYYYNGVLGPNATTGNNGYAKGNLTLKTNLPDSATDFNVSFKAYLIQSAGLTQKQAYKALYEKFNELNPDTVHDGFTPEWLALQ